MLLNDFFSYRLISQEDAKFSVNIDLVADHKIYEGHFPSIPITPGVCQVQMVKEVLEDILCKKFSMTAARDIQFLAMINPNEVSHAKLDVSYIILEDGKYQVTALMASESVKYLKLRADYCEK